MRHLANTFCLAAIAAAMSTPPGAHAMETPPMPKKDDCNFGAIVPGTKLSTPCSPVVDDDFRGIAIRGPAEVTYGPRTEDPLFGGFTKLIVCGLVRLPYPTLGLRGQWNEAVVLVAVDTRAKQVFAGGLMPFGSPARRVDPLAKSDLTASDFAGVVSGSYFNPNIARDLNLPAREADYDVYATLGPYRSNVVHVKVRRQK
jgi:hypothetical protein